MDKIELEKELETELEKIWENQVEFSLNYKNYGYSDHRSFTKAVFDYGDVIGKKIPYLKDGKDILFRKEEIFIYCLFRGTGIKSSDNALTLEYINYYKNFEEDAKVFIDRLIEMEILRKIDEKSDNQELFALEITSGINNVIDLVDDRFYYNLQGQYKIHIHNKELEIIRENDKIKKNLDKAVEDVDKTRKGVDKVQNNVNKLYLNIISIMGIFIAIFSFITVNLNIFGNMTNNKSLFEKSSLVIIANILLIMVIKHLFMLISNFGVITHDKEKTTKEEKTDKKDSWKAIWKDIKKWAKENWFELAFIVIFGIIIAFSYYNGEHLKYNEKVMIVQSRLVDNLGVELVIDGENGTDTQRWMKITKEVLGYEVDSLEISNKFMRNLKNLSDEEIKLIREKYELKYIQ